MGEARTTTTLSDSTVEHLQRLLPKLATHDRAIEPRAYARFYEAPGVQALFGSSAATRRQMFDDTLVGVYDLAERGPWVEEQMRAFGSRHRHTYEVTVAMYDNWRDAVVDATSEVLGESLDDAERMALRDALEALHAAMLRGAYPKGLPR